MDNRDINNVKKQLSV